jgi:peptidyl-prolyl cis-trans isomerase SurA
MTWRGLIGLSLVTSGLVTGGCETGRPYQAARAADPPTPAGEAVARAQRPDPGAQRLTRLPSPPAGEAVPTALKITGEPADRIRAVVGDVPILDSEVRLALHPLMGGVARYNPRTQAEAEEIEKKILNDLIEREVVVQDCLAHLKRGPNGAGAKLLDKLKEEADKEFDKHWILPRMKFFGMKSEEEFRKMLRASGFPLEMARRDWERMFIFHAYVRNQIEKPLDRVGHTQILEYYKSHPEEFQVADRVEWQDLFVATDSGKYGRGDGARKYAEVLAQRVRSGEEIPKLVAAGYDDGDSTLRQGAGIGSKRGDISPREAEPLLFLMKPGEVAVLPLPTGFHVIRLVKREYAGMKPFDDDKVQKQIRNKLRGEVAEQEIKVLVAKLKRKTVVRIIP